MKYLIDLAMLYEVDSGVIMINGEEESSIKLSNQAARLLYELIINNGKTLDRDDLIKKVWEDHGFSGSSVSLNVAISEIRKAFRSLGRDPLLIKTIRGKGFSLAAHIEHHTVRPPVSAPEKMVAEVADIVTQQRDPPERLRRRDSGFTTLCVMALVAIMGIAALLFYQNMRMTERAKESDIHLLGKIDRCTVYLIDKNMYQPQQTWFSRAKQAIARQQIDCEHQAADMYYSKFKKSQLENDFLAVCYLQDSGDSYKNCISYRSLTGS
ncbi:winged helix-turn-helix domain-containing protein [Enterobacter cloacae]|uniref:winged helix-turn-helix domain-containing protein n=1 Tax=Enterobacter cloacae TaxID=550 RepID=UPI004042894E